MTHMYEEIISHKLAEKIKELRQKNSTITIVEKASNYGYVISKKEPAYYITKKGEREIEYHTVYNILELDATLLSDDWFSTYKFNSAGDCIIGFTKKVDDPGSKKRNKQETKLRYGAVNERGCLAVKPYYESLEFGTEQTYIAGANDKKGYVDMGTGKEITPIVFRKAHDFKDGLARVEVELPENGVIRYGYVSREKILHDPFIDEEYGISPKFISATDFKDGLAKVLESYDESEYYINTKSQKVKAPKLELKR